MCPERIPHSGDQLADVSAVSTSDAQHPVSDWLVVAAVVAQPGSDQTFSRSGVGAASFLLGRGSPLVGHVGRLPCDVDHWIGI